MHKNLMGFLKHDCFLGLILHLPFSRPGVRSGMQIFNIPSSDVDEEKGYTEQTLRNAVCPISRLKSALSPSSMPALSKVTLAPPCCSPLSVLCVLQIAFALHLWTNQVSSARPIRAGIFPGLMHQWHICQHRPVPTSLQLWLWLMMMQDTWLIWWRAALVPGKSRKSHLICRLGSFDLKVTGGKRNMGPRDVSSSPSLAVITPEKHFSPSASSSPFLHRFNGQRRGKKQQTLSDFLDDSSFSLCTEGERVKIPPSTIRPNHLLCGS